MSCKCQECGKQFKVDLNIPDKLWGKIKPKNKSEDAGLLCGSCIMKKIEEINNYDYWDLIKMNKIEILGITYEEGKAFERIDTKPILEKKGETNNGNQN